MRHPRVEELLHKLKGTIAARAYLDLNPVAVQILSKEEAEHDVLIAASSLFTCFVDASLWCGAETDEVGEVCKSLASAYSCITDSEVIKERALALSVDCLKFSAEQLRKRVAS